MLLQPLHLPPGCMQMLTAYAWGAAVPRAGVKALVLMSGCTACIANGALGFASSLPAAVLLRFVGGLVNCANGTLKTAVAQSFPAQHQVCCKLSARPCLHRALHHSHGQVGRGAG